MKKADCQEYTLIRLKDIKNEHLIRSFYTEDPLKYLKLYKKTSGSFLLPLIKQQ